MTGSRPHHHCFPAPPRAASGLPAAATAGRARLDWRRPSPRRRPGDAPRLVVLGERHRAACTAHLLSLDPGDRNDRFWCAADDGYIRRYAAGLGAPGHILVGAMQGRRVVGLAHVAPYPEGGGLAAEIGISVDADARKRGLGRRLLRAALEAAGRARPGCVHVLFRTMNSAMAALARSLGGQLGHDGAEAFAVFEPPPAGATGAPPCRCRRVAAPGAAYLRRRGRTRTAGSRRRRAAGRGTPDAAGGTPAVRLPAGRTGAARRRM